MKQHSLSVSKTARYYSLGTFDAQTKEVWFVIHGYMQLARNFLKDFEGLDHNRVIVAPEGLNRFYSKGLGGTPAASWMTSEAREEEIQDYLNYLDRLAETVIPENFSGTLNLLGFSQGVATGTRWIHHSPLHFRKLILYAGEIAAELRNPLSEKLKALECTYITGTRDPLLREENRAGINRLMEVLQAKRVEFDGGHEIRPDLLKQELGSH